MEKRNFIRLFELRKGHLDSRVKRDYVTKGIATIPCRISSYSDVINPYSAQDYETPNTEFLDYLQTTASVTPPECPLVLNIIGGGLSQEEKETVEETVRDYFAYALGVVEKKEKRHTWTFVLMLIGLIVSGILLWLTEPLVEEPRELIYILFWFMGETLCDYIFLRDMSFGRIGGWPGVWRVPKSFFPKAIRPQSTQKAISTDCTPRSKRM